MFNKFIKIIFIYFVFSNLSIATEVEKIIIEGNSRVNSETIKMFSNVSIGDELSNFELNEVLKDIYETNFFDDVKVFLENKTLKIIVNESPIINNVLINGVKNKTLEKALLENIEINKGSSFNKFLVENNIKKINNILINSGFYFSKIDASVREYENNSIDILFNISLGEKAYIGKIEFIGDKIFKSRKLRNIIVSEENKFWKFISNKKYINKERIELDKRLLLNFYKNKGYFNASIESETIEFLEDNNFKLSFKINAGNKFYFNNLAIDFPDNYDQSYFNKIQTKLNKFSNELYSFKILENILDEIENIAKTENYEFVDANLDEIIIGTNLIDVKIKIIESNKFYVRRINLLGNNVTREEVVRNELIIDEGDSLNNILFNKSINNIKSLNIFRKVDSEIIDTDNQFEKIINITVEEKPTGEISIGAGVGTSGASTIFGVKENNFLGKGITLNSNLSLSKETIKGQFFVVNPNFNNSNRDLIFNLQSLETDRLTDYGYKTNKTGFSLGTNFEHLEDFYISPSVEINNEKLTTSSTATELLKKQKGSYFDIRANYSLEFDKRNQKYSPSDGFRSFFSQSIPLSINDNQTIINTYDFTKYHEYKDDNVLSVSFFAQTSNSFGDNDVRISERIYIPANKLRGFEIGKIGPVDNGDFVGGNYITSLNIATELPIFQSLDSVSFSSFYDMANVWGVDYSSSINESNKIRSSIGLSADWFTPIGPLSFSFAHPISKAATDKTEGFRFNLGTSF